MLTVEPLTPHIGARVDGLDLRSAPDAATAEALNAALLEHLVLVIPGQMLTPAQLRDALGAFGELMPQHRARFNLPECPEVSRVDNRGGFAPAVMWHTDHTNHECPPKITSLYGVEIPDQGGDTEFASMYAALDALPARECAGLRGTHTHNAMEGHSGYTAEDRARYPGGARHPMVRLHPETQRPALYFHVTKSQAVERHDGTTIRGEAAQHYLEALLDRAIDEDRTYRHRWRRGDLLVCDNRCTMHRVHADFAPDAHRLLWRVLVRGDRPVGAAS